MGDEKETIQAYLDKEGCQNTYLISFYSRIWRYIILDSDKIQFYTELLKQQGLYKVEYKVFNLSDIDDIPSFRTRIFLSHKHHTVEDTRETLLDSLLGSCFRIHINKIPARSEERSDLTYVHVNLYPGLRTEWTSAEGRRTREDISSDVNFYLKKIEEKKAPYDYIEVTYSLSSKASIILSIYFKAHLFFPNIQKNESVILLRFIT